MKGSELEWARWKVGREKEVARQMEGKWCTGESIKHSTLVGDHACSCMLAVPVFLTTRQFHALLHSVERLALLFCSDRNYCVGFELILRVQLYQVRWNFWATPRLRAWVHATAHLLGEQIEKDLKGSFASMKAFKSSQGDRRGNR